MAAGPQLTASLSLDTRDFDKNLKAAESKANRFDKNLKAEESKSNRFAKALKSVATVGGVKNAYDYAREMMNLSRATGISKDKISDFHLALEDSNLSANEMIVATRLMSQHLLKAAEGQYESVHAFNQLGLSWKELLTLPLDEVFTKVGSAISNIENPALRSAAAIRHFGDTGGKALKLFARGGALDMAKEALGGQGSIVGNDGRIFEQISIRLSHIGVKIRGIFMGIAQATLPMVDKFTDIFHKMDFTNWGKRFGAALNDAMVGGLAFFMDPEAGLAVFWASMQNHAATFINWFAGGMVAAFGAMWNAGKGFLEAGINEILAALPKVLGGGGKVNLPVAPVGGKPIEVMKGGKAASPEMQARWAQAKMKAGEKLGLVQMLEETVVGGDEEPWYLRGFGSKLWGDARSQLSGASSSMLAGSGFDVLKKQNMVGPRLPTDFTGALSTLQGGSTNVTPLLRAGETRRFRNAAIAARSGRILAAGGDPSRPGAGGEFDASAMRRPGETVNGDRQRAKAFAREVLRKEKGQGTDNQLLGDIALNTAAAAQNTAIFKP